MITINHLITSGNIGPLRMQICPPKEFGRVVLMFFRWARWVRLTLGENTALGWNLRRDWWSKRGRLYFTVSSTPLISLQERLSGLIYTFLFKLRRSYISLQAQGSRTPAPVPDGSLLRNKTQQSNERNGSNLIMWTIYIQLTCVALVR